MFEVDTHHLFSLRRTYHLIRHMTSAMSLQQQQHTILCTCIMLLNKLTSPCLHDIAVGSHHVCSGYTPCLHDIAVGLHHVCSRYTPCFHDIAVGLHHVCSRYTPCLHDIAVGSHHVPMTYGSRFTPSILPSPVSPMSGHM